MGRFLDIAELIDPEMPRARVKAVFLAALGVSLHMPTDTSTRLLGQDSAWEGIVRLALLQIANTSTSLPDVAPPSPVGAPPSRQAQAQNAKELSGAELACSLTEMSKAQLRDLRSASSKWRHASLVRRPTRLLSRRPQQRPFNPLRVARRPYLYSRTSPCWPWSWKRSNHTDSSCSDCL